MEKSLSLRNAHTYACPDKERLSSMHHQRYPNAPAPPYKPSRPPLPPRAHSRRTPQIRLSRPKPRIPHHIRKPCIPYIPAQRDIRRAVDLDALGAGFMFEIRGAVARHLGGFGDDAAADAVAEGGASRK